FFDGCKCFFGIRGGGCGVEDLVQQGNTGGDHVASKRSIRPRHRKPGEQTLMRKINDVLCASIRCGYRFLELNHSRSMGLGLQIAAEVGGEQQNRPMEQETQGIEEQSCVETLSFLP